MRRDRSLMRFLAGLVLVGTLASCNPDRVVRSEKGPKATVNLRSQILGLSVKLEDVSEQVGEIDRPYFDSVAVFTMRENDLVRATLEVGRFNSLAQPGSASFRQRIVSRIGSQAPEAFRMGGKTVYVTAGNKQNIFLWFSGRGMFLLITHADYVFPRTLLRRLLEMDLKL